MDDLEDDPASFWVSSAYFQVLSLLVLGRLIPLVQMFSIFPKKNT